MYKLNNLRRLKNELEKLAEEHLLADSGKFVDCSKGLPVSYVVTRMAL